MAGPLAGIRVVEVGRFVTGPEASVLLADMGAEVIKVEDAGVGDPFRHYYAGGYAPPFRSLNRNKKSLALDIATVEGKDVLIDLIGTADILIENYRAGQTDGWGWGWDTLHEKFPRLIYCSITGFGATGPYRDRPGYDTVGVGYSGLLSAFVDLEDPEPPSISLADHLSGIYAAYGVLGALHARDVSGLGQKVETSLLQSCVAFLAEYASIYFETGRIPKRGDRAKNAIAWAFVAQDKKPFVIHLSTPPKFWKGLATTIGHPEWVDDPRFATAAGRRENYDVLVTLMRTEFAKRPRSEWLDALIEADVPCAPLNTLDEVFVDPQVMELGMHKVVEHPQRGPVHLVAPGVVLGGTPLEWDTAPPVLGEHTLEVLSGLGYGAAQIEQLRRDQRIRIDGQPFGDEAAQ
jgi:crotonobetainyl-CoA:carnitine CoA-transferase CaiB-like acyl-CoA transferase